MATAHTYPFNKREDAINPQNGPSPLLRWWGGAVHGLPTSIAHPNRLALLLGFVVCSIVAIGLALIIDM